MTLHNSCFCVIINSMKTQLFYVRPDGTEQEIHHVTSDTHIGHKNIAKYAGRPYDNSDNTDAMDADLIRIWNETVSPDETVLHLGDAAMGKLEETVPVYGKMNGTKLLVPGNHDAISSDKRASQREKYSDLYAEYFTVLPEVINLIARVGEKDYKLRASHYPYKNVHTDTDRFDKVRPAWNGEPLLHGHTHSENVFQKPPFIPGCDVYVIPSPEFHVGVDAHGFMPVKADTIARWVSTLK